MSGPCEAVCRRDADLATVECRFVEGVVLGGRITCFLGGSHAWGRRLTTGEALSSDSCAAPLADDGCMLRGPCASAMCVFGKHRSRLFGVLGYEYVHASTSFLFWAWA
jgi:hypothetical protein